MTYGVMAEVQREQEFVRTADTINKFIVSTAQFLNRFAARCDSQLFEMGRSLQRLEILTLLLEKKLKSVDEEFDDIDNATSTVVPPAPTEVSGFAPLAITGLHAPPPMPGLSAVTALHNRPPPPPPQQLRKGPPPPPGVVMLSAHQNGTVATSLPAVLSTPPPVLPGQPSPGSRPPPPPPMPLLTGFTMSTHPRLQGYFQMLALRVPTSAIKAKMQMDGYQPEWLDTPDAAAPSTLLTTSNTLYDSD